MDVVESTRGRVQVDRRTLSRLGATRPARVDDPVRLGTPRDERPDDDIELGETKRLVI
jgi:hypothetical protein